MPDLQLAPHHGARPSASLGLNGLGRIGRAIFRLATDRRPGTVRAVNDLRDDRENLSYLLRFDSVYGRSNLRLEQCESGWTLDGVTVPVSHFEAIDEVGWSVAGADVVVDSSGAEGMRAQYEHVLAAGARSVVITQLTEAADFLLYPGVNDAEFDPARHRIVSAGTCDGMALAPVLKRVHGSFGIVGGSVTTLHPMLSYQNVLDGPPSAAALPKQYGKAYGLGRASGSNVIPKETSAVRAVELALPEITGRLQAMSFRVPTQAVSMAAVWLTLSRGITIDDLRSTLAGIAAVHVNEEELVSTDLIGTEHSAVVDGRFTTVAADGRQVRLMIWYDNEWGYAAHVLRVVGLIDRYTWPQRRQCPRVELPYSDKQMHRG